MRSSVSILRRRVQTSALVALVGLIVVACESGSSRSLPAPTAPISTAPTSVSAPDLAGTWVGSETVTWDPTDGGGGCSGPVTVTFAHSGSTVTATLPQVPGCVNEPLRFEGTLTGNVLRGNIVFPAYTWPTFGQASEDHVTMAAMNVSWDLRR